MKLNCSLESGYKYTSGSDVAAVRKRVWCRHVGKEKVVFELMWLCSYISEYINIHIVVLAKITYLGVTLISRNCIHEEMKSILNSGNAC
jgi:hypothetical protein